MKNNILLTKITLGTVAAGELGGTIDNPVKKCDADKCVLDFGPFVFNGVPEDFGSFVETAGTAGGSDKVADMLEVIAEYLEESGDIAGSEEYSKLANLGHFMGNVQEIIENSAKDCQSETVYANQLNCFDNAIGDRTKEVTIPDNISDVLTNYKSGLDVQKLIEQGTIIGEAKNEKNSSSPTMYERDASTYPSYAMVKYYDQIMANPNYSEKLKLITTELYRNIADLSYQQAGKVMSIDGRSGVERVRNYDSLTGSRLEDVNFYLEDGLNDILTPEASNYIDLDSALICVANGNAENANNCHTR